MAQQRSWLREFAWGSFVFFSDPHGNRVLKLVKDGLGCRGCHSCLLRFLLPMVFVEEGTLEDTHPSGLLQGDVLAVGQALDDPDHPVRDILGL
jgi:hypothetical protein